MSRAAVFLIISALAGAAIPAAMAQPAAVPAVRAIGLDERPGERIPLDLVFTDSRGEPAKLGQFFGDERPVLLILAYNRCAMLCSLVLRGAADVVSQLDMTPGRDFRVITVSIDPGDTAQQAFRQQELMLERIGLPGQTEVWPFLVGQEPAIAALARSLGFRYAWDERTQQYAHPAVIFAITPEGRISRYVQGVAFPRDEVAGALRDAAAGRVGAVAGEGGGLLSCFRFSAALGEYGPAIQLMFQVGALMILLTLLSGLWFLIRRQARRS
jgi:protein SCO1